MESADLGFLIQVLQETDNGPKSSLLETRVLKLSGEVLYMTIACTVTSVWIPYEGVSLDSATITLT